MRDDRILLMDMLISAEAIEEFIRDLSEDAFLENRLVQSALLRELQVIGEAARQMSKEGQSTYTQVNWRRIAGMRNRIVHEYFDVRLDVVWDTAKRSTKPASCS
jgi:uncharacterized protein with HEPN domain